jgi:periplasmic protein TonB
MAMNLMDRPVIADSLDAHHRTGGAMASVAVHITVLLSLVAILRSVPPRTTTDSRSVTIPGQPIWFPTLEIGGGRNGGGDHSIAPPRRIREVGHDAASTPQATAPSENITAQAPEEPSALPARPTGDAPSPLVGIVESDGASLGPGPTGAGMTVGNDPGGLGIQPGSGFGPDANHIGGPGVTTPTLLHQVKPRYTADAMRLRIQGSVWVECVVLPDGSVGDARVTRSLDARFGLDDEAIAAAKQWRFRAGTLNGRPVPVIVSIELMFSVR